MHTRRTAVLQKSRIRECEGRYRRTGVETTERKVGPCYFPASSFVSRCPPYPQRRNRGGRNFRLSDSRIHVVVRHSLSCALPHSFFLFSSFVSFFFFFILFFFPYSLHSFSGSVTAGTQRSYSRSMPVGRTPGRYSLSGKHGFSFGSRLSALTG